MTGKEYQKIASIIADHDNELAEQYKRGEITAEEQIAELRDNWGFWSCIYSPDEVAEGERLALEESKKHRADALRDDFGAGEPLKDIAAAEREYIKDRLKSIPAELELIFYLYSKGKIIFDGGWDFSEAIDKYDGIDIVFMDPEITEPGITNQAGGDVKNTKYEHPNFFIETAKKNTKTGNEWSEKYAWGKHVLNPENRNRYIFYVRGDDFGQDQLIDEKMSERENTLRILEHYYSKPEELNHVIEIIRAEDVRKYLADHPEERPKAIKDYCKGYKIPKEEWIRAELPALRITRGAEGWQETQLTESNPLVIQTEKYQTKGNISSREKQLRKEQAEGLSLERLKSLYGIPDKMRSEAEIKEQIDREYGHGY